MWNVVSTLSDGPEVAVRNFCQSGIDAVMTPDSSTAFRILPQSELLALPLISYAATDAELSDPSFAYFMRTCLSNTQLPVAAVRAIRHYGWRSVGLLLSDDEDAVPFTAGFITEAQAQGVEVEETLTMKRSGEMVLGEVLDFVKRLKLRVLEVDFNDDDALELFQALNSPYSDLVKPLYHMHVAVTSENFRLFILVVGGRLRVAVDARFGDGERV